MLLQKSTESLLVPPTERIDAEINRAVLAGISYAVVITSNT